MSQLCSSPYVMRKFDFYFILFFEGIVMYRKVVGFKLGSYEQNFGSLRLNILVLEEYVYAY